jgi:hypothetical protein
MKDLPPELLGNAMQHLLLKKQKSGESDTSFDDDYPRKFVYPCDRKTIQARNSKKLNDLAEQLSGDFISALINLYAHKKKVEFILSNGVDPLLLQSAIKRASTYV